MKKAISGTIILLILSISTYFGYNYLQDQKTSQPNDTKMEDQDKIKEEKEELVKEPDPIVITEASRSVVTIGTDLSYIQYPIIDNKSEIKIILYSHGSITNVVQDLNDPFMLDMQLYGDYFTSKGYIFSASNEHGANWGSNQALADMTATIDFITNEISQVAINKQLADYKVDYKTYLIGYSMGGLPTMNFATKYPEKIKKIALLAPTTRLNEWSAARFDILKPIDVRIWHGDQDVNVPWSLSNSFVKTAATYGKTVELTTLNGKTHWDIHTAYFDDIYNFFELSADTTSETTND